MNFPTRTTAFLILASLLIGQNTFSQTLTQTLKGKILDNETQAPLLGATVVILNSDPLLGVITDFEGNYKISAVPLGRYNIQISYVGYEPAIVSEILVTSGKEVVINVGLTQSSTLMEELTIKAYSRKDKPLNSMASVSARSFTVEETRRYAGGVDDPARLASAFAGVSVGNIQDNAIIIRGNSPKGVSWRLEGVEIPNPNHFSGGNVAGGGFVTIFSSQLLANSDFFTGAFPAEYGNALAGVFDMKLRNGNREKREHTIQAGIMGIDISSEGPFKKEGKASYLFNYRYSTMGLLSDLGILPSAQIPRYQDLSFKLNFPTQKAGTFSLWGIGAIDDNNEPDELDINKWETDWDRINFNWGINTGAIGLSHKMILGEKSYVNTTLAATGTENKLQATRLDSAVERRPYWDNSDNSGKVILSSFYNHKFGAKHTLKTGINYSALFYDLDFNATINDVPETFQNFVKENGRSSFLEYYIQSRYEISKNVSVNMGVNANYFALNEDYSVDPRVGIKWEFHPQHSISFGYGKHSQLEELKIYLLKKELNGDAQYPNKNLRLSQAQHLIFGYDLLINDNLRLKIEPYFQYLDDIPGIADSSYSMINYKQERVFMESLENNSVGRNIGIDFTLERFLNRNYYYLMTASVFDSKYKGDDGIWHNTRYDKGFVINLLFGKEYFMKNNRVLSVNGRLNMMGGERYSPVLTNESIQDKLVIYDESNAFDEQLPAMYYLDLSISYRANKTKYSGVWAFQVKNVLGSPMLEGYAYNYKTNDIQRIESVIVVPMISYKIEF
ncbi:MAG: TonB-dependent receptor [Bacteroidales bacterium]|nr:TonB-dependent receptor [Bacteroidales bacterium]MCF8390915.1 TonB-dependent receptor [Bacteroidales bacterium]